MKHGLNIHCPAMPDRWSKQQQIKWKKHSNLYMKYIIPSRVFIWSLQLTSPSDKCFCNNNMVNDSEVMWLAACSQPRGFTFTLKQIIWKQISVNNSAGNKTFLFLANSNPLDNEGRSFTLILVDYLILLYVHWENSSQHHTHTHTHTHTH